MSVGLDRVLYKPFRKSPTIVLVIASFGAALMIRSVIQLVWGVKLESYASGSFAKPLLFFDTFRIAERHTRPCGLARPLILVD